MRTFLVALLFIPIGLNAQDAYFSVEEVAFATPLEQQIIARLLNDEEQVFRGFLAISSEDSLQFAAWEDKFYYEMRQLAARKIPKKQEKDFKNIYNKLNEQFLRKYALTSFFDEIFETGVFNCVTAVALYGMAFEELGISYTIKETPTHVYIVADPDGSQLLIETTDPVGGFKSFSPGFKENYVAQLGLMKVIDQNDIASQGIYSIFEEYYFGGADLTLSQLVGIQYYNKGVKYFNEQKYEKAMHEMKKAQLFYASKQVIDILFGSIINVLAKGEYASWDHIQLIPYLARFKAYDINNSNIVAEYAQMLDVVLSSENDELKADSAYQYFVSNVTDTLLINEVSFLHYYERGRLKYNRANYEEALSLMARAYGYKPGNANAEMLLIESFRMSFYKKGSEQALAALDTLLAEHSELSKNNRVTQLKLNLYLTKMGEDFTDRKASSGNEMKALFEESLEANPNLPYNEDILANAYANAAVYYFR